MISIVVCSINPAKFAAGTASFAAAMGDARHEIVAIHDARSLCEGYNRGVARARGDICVFAHDDIEILTRDLAGTLQRHLGDRDVVGIAGTTRLAGMGWDEETFDGWHGYDTDFTFRCHRAGLRLAVALDIPLIHFSNGNVGTAWLEYDRRFCAKHAGKLAGGEGIWLNVRRHVRTRTEVCAAYELSPLVALTS